MVVRDTYTIVCVVMVVNGNMFPLAVDHKDAVENYQKMVTEPIKHSRRPCGGIWKDLKKLALRYPSDLRDALTPQVFYSIIFIYISFLAPAIAFGGLMEEVTGNLIGETETLCVTGVGGVLYGLFALQPLTVLAFTGPVLVFESIIFEVGCGVLKEREGEMERERGESEKRESLGRERE